MPEIKPNFDGLIAIALGEESLAQLRGGEVLRLGDMAEQAPQLHNVVLIYESEGLTRRLKQGEIPLALRKALDENPLPSPSHIIPVVEYEFQPECATEAALMFTVANKIQKALHEAKAEQESIRDKVHKLIGKAPNGPFLTADNFPDDALPTIAKLIEQGQFSSWFLQAMNYLDETGQAENFVNSLMLTISAPHRAKHRHGKP